MMFRLAHPALLALFLMVFAWLAWRLTRRPVGITCSMAGTLAHLSGGGRRLAGHIPLMLRTGCLVLLVLTAARPQLYNVSRDIDSPGVDIILCLDTSGSMQALDFKTDSALRKALKEKTGDSTVLIVTQRVATVKRADQIIVLDEGRIVERGQHEDLVALGGIYADINQRQLLEEAIEQEA